MRNLMTQASGAQMTQAIVAGGGTSIALNLVVSLISAVLGGAGLLVAIFAPVAIGYIVGEVVYKAAGYSRAKNIAWAAAGSVFLGFAVVTALFGQPVGAIGMLIGMYFAYKRISP